MHINVNAYSDSSQAYTWSTRENKTKEGAEGKQAEPANEIDLETPDQSVDEVKKKTTESTPMPNTEEPNQKSTEFSPIDTVEDTTGNTPETVKDESQAKRTSFTERLAMMVGMKSRDIVTEEPKVEKGKTFGTISTKTTETNQDEDQVKQGAAANNRATADHETTTSLELGDLMAKLDQIDKRLKHSEKDRDVIKKELGYNKHEYLDNYFNLAKATEEKLQQMSDKVDATDGERGKNIKKDMQEMKQRYDAVNSQLESLETRMDTMSRDQAESSCAIQAKLDAILRNSTSQDRPAADRTQGNRVDFVEPQRNKRTRDKYQNADSLSKKTEFYERQEQRDADRPEIKDGFSFMDKETYDSLPLSRWLDKSGEPIEDHPELPEEPPKKTILKKTRGMPIEIMFKSKIVEDSEKSSDDQDSLCMILAEEKMRHRDKELQTDPSSGTYNSDEQEVQGGEEIEKIAVSRKPFRELSCN
ncbi:uncharacterized protein LOC134840451 [Symsagittifera roscoffensis]|uniref:uncharacterized protein LOC134840451 n=1 Tax=Symsagittifera roscoffensis TaxID=84072 RepID=UPI00307BBD4B